MNIGSPLAAIISPLIFGYVIDKTGNWDLPFIGSMGLLLLGAILAFWIKPDVGLRQTDPLGRGEASTVHEIQSPPAL
jgi:cyanate permease